MKVLWLSNQMPPMAAQILGREAGNKEGWLTGLLEQVVRHGRSSSDDTADTEKKDLELGICFPIAALSEERQRIFLILDFMRIPYTARGMTAHWKVSWRISCGNFSRTSCIVSAPSTLIRWR